MNPSFIFVIALACIMVKACNSLPSTGTKESLQSPVRVAVNKYMNIFLNQIEENVNIVLRRIPNTENYDDSRTALSDFITGNQRYRKLENCIWNIADLNRDFSRLINFFEKGNVSPARQEVMSLLRETGLVALKHDVGLIFYSFINEDLGPTNGINEDYCY